jgi:hypothetical protein
LTHLMTSLSPHLENFWNAENWGFSHFFREKKWKQFFYYYFS